jgi:VWFA-related protein
MPARMVRGWVLVSPVTLALVFLLPSGLSPLGLWSLGLPPGSAVATHGNDKSIFVSALDGSGKPVKDLTVSELRIREDGVEREVSGLMPAIDPLTIALLADTTKGADEYIRDIRDALSAFVRQVRAASPDAPITLMEFGQASITVVPFTTNTDDLDKGITKLVGKPNAKSVLLEAIIEASGQLAKRPSPRRAIVVLNMEPSDEQSREEPKKINDALRKSGAQLWAVSLQKGTMKNPTRDIVLNALTKNTGGSREFIVGQSALGAVLTSYAGALTAQYELTYKRPNKSAQVVQVATTRQGLTLHASGFAPH